MSVSVSVPCNSSFTTLSGSMPEFLPDASCVLSGGVNIGYKRFRECYLLFWRVLTKACCDLVGIRVGGEGGGGLQRLSA